MIELKPEGYWGPQEGYPMPVPFVLSQNEADTICYLIKAKEELAERVDYMGDSYCRFTNMPLGNGEYELDGWKWPEDFAPHYVKKYGVKPTDEFLAFIGYGQG